jgi:GTP 3',8-cyclase
MPLIDPFGRTINYLRLSVTDRCDLRCSYCMPEEGVPKLGHRDILSYEELYLLAEAAVSLGVEKVRVTGGEPLVRKGIVDFLRRLAGLAGLKELVLTTNGMQLAELAEPLRQAGVQRLNVSLDSLRPEVFAKITRRGDLSRVLAGIEAAKAAGLPLKINMVVMRGINDAELAEVAALSLDGSCSVRFIEYMPAIQAENWQSLVVPGKEILERLAADFNFAPVLRQALAGPAREFRIQGAKGTIGVITALSGHFCQDCNRFRATASGKLRSCLFSDQEVDLRPLLSGGDPAAIRSALGQLITTKPAGHRLSEAEADHRAFSMAQIGG